MEKKLCFYCPACDHYGEDKDEIDDVEDNCTICGSEEIGLAVVFPKETIQ